MTLADFDYDLPRERIALRPAEPRDAARLLVVGPTLEDRWIRDLPALLRPGDLLVANDTAVFPARLRGRRGAAAIEVTLLRPLAERPTVWNALARPAKRLKVGDLVEFGDRRAEVLARRGGEVDLEFSLDPEAVITLARGQGEVPLPPYIERARPTDRRDTDDYQTIFARRVGAVAAPTAGLHFTHDLLNWLRDTGVERVTVTLHVGAGTFLPIQGDSLDAHVMHAEWGELSPDVAARIEEVKARGGKIVAVGTTSVRLLETAAREDGRLRPFSGDTTLFVKPGFRFRVVDRMVTNFHLPRSTLLVLVSAFAGAERVAAAYRHAIASGYRFYSYGDACLLDRAA